MSVHMPFGLRCLWCIPLLPHVRAQTNRNDNVSFVLALPLNVPTTRCSRVHPAVLGRRLPQHPHPGWSSARVRRPEETRPGVPHDRPGCLVPHSHSQQGGAIKTELCYVVQMLLSTHSFQCHLHLVFRVFLKTEPLKPPRLLTRHLSHSHSHKQVPVLPDRMPHLQSSPVGGLLPSLLNRYCCHCWNVIPPPLAIGL